MFKWFAIVTALNIFLLFLMAFFFINHFYILFGKSMEPTINSTNIIQCIPQKNYTMGDIVCYLNESTRICHRIVGSFNQTWIVKGDNNKITDYETYSNEDILCKVTNIIDPISALQVAWNKYSIFLLALLFH